LEVKLPDDRVTNSGSGKASFRRRGARRRTRSGSTSGPTSTDPDRKWTLLSSKLRHGERSVVNVIRLFFFVALKEDKHF